MKTLRVVIEEMNDFDEMEMTYAAIRVGKRHD